MRIYVGALSPNAAATRFALVALMALAAVFVAVVLMHGMNGTHAAASHTAAAPTMSGKIVDEPVGHSVEERGAAAGPSVVQGTAGLASPVSAELGEAGEEPLPGVAILALVMLVTLVLLVRRVKPSRVFFAPPHVLATGWTRTFLPAVPLRLAVSIDRR